MGLKDLTGLPDCCLKNLPRLCGKGRKAVPSMHRNLELFVIQGFRSYLDKRGIDDQRCSSLHSARTLRCRCSV